MNCPSVSKPELLAQFRVRTSHANNQVNPGHDGFEKFEFTLFR
jgi:hypothetical protein